MAKPTLTVRIDADRLAWLKDRAVRDHRTVTATLELLLAAAEQDEKKGGK